MSIYSILTCQITGVNPLELPSASQILSPSTCMNESSFRTTLKDTISEKLPLAVALYSYIQVISFWYL